MDLNQWFNQGLTPEEYLDTLAYHKENFHQIYNHFSLSDDDRDVLKTIQKQNLRVVVLAEVWCGHCMLCVPILLRLAEKAGMPVRFLPRDDNLELMDHYLTNEKRIIPIFIFIDEDGNEVAKWGPMAETTRNYVDELKKDLPPKDAEDYKEKFKVYAKETSQAFVNSHHIQQGTYDSIVKTLVNS